MMRIRLFFCFPRCKAFPSGEGIGQKIHPCITKPKRESPVRLPFRKGRRTQRMCSFRGSYANRGNGTELSSSDVVPLTGLEPVTFRGRF